jgi:hypothetical protein
MLALIFHWDDGLLVRTDADQMAIRGPLLLAL